MLLASDRNELAHSSARAANNLREELGLSDIVPGCPFEAAHALGVSVRITDINMEGIYARVPRPTIILSCFRPFGRRVFNAAHELGHHVFGHGTTLDQLQERNVQASWEDPDEFLADIFAGFFLMPLLGIRRCFNVRNWSVEHASAKQIYLVACDLGVGYRTLITHLTYSLRLLTSQRARELKMVDLRKLRADILGENTSCHLTLAGPNRAGGKIDLEAGAYLAVPSGTVVDSSHLEPVKNNQIGFILRASRPGVTVIAKQNWRATVRIQRSEYVGLAQYRHMEEL